MEDGSAAKSETEEVPTTIDKHAYYLEQIKGEYENKNYRHQNIYHFVNISAVAGEKSTVYWQIDSGTGDKWRIT